MALTDTLAYASLRNALAGARELTDDERAALAQELATDPAGRGYKGEDGQFKPAAELFLLVNDPYTVANPTPQPPVDRTDCSIDEFMTFLAGPRLAAAQSSDPAIAAKWAGLTSILLPFVTPLSRVPLTAVTTRGIMSQIVTDGLLAQQTVAAFLTVPDPAYQPVLQRQGRGEQVVGAVVEVREIVAAVAAVEAQG